MFALKNKVKTGRYPVILKKNLPPLIGFYVC